MKDLYKRIGLPGQTESIALIEEAVHNCDAPYSLKQSAQYILLNSARKEVYDRNYMLLKIIGQVRANTGLNRTQSWLLTHSGDFDCDPIIKQNIPKKEEQLIHTTFLSGLWKLFIRLFARLIGIAMALGIFLLIGLGIDSCEDKPTARSSYQYTPPSYSSKPPSNNYTPPKPYQPPISQFNEPPLLLPYNGYTIRHHTTEAIAPFEIKTRSGSGNYFVKLVDYYTKNAVLTVFVREGQTVNLDVPLGSYELKYAVGRTWYGTKHLFGPDTACSKADDRFDFKQIGNQLSGYTVELYLQTHGNLETDPIPITEF